MNNVLYLDFSSLIYRAVSKITDMVNAYKENAKIKATIRELQALHDRDLLDMGINRYDIPFIVRNKE